MMKKILFALLTLGLFNSCMAGRTERTTATVYNVTDYGAMPNDAKDDSKAIQKCVNDAIKNNGKVRFASGKYNISETIQINFLGANQSLEIDGANATIMSKPLLKKAIESNGTSAYSSLSISNLGLDGQVSRRMRDSLFDGTYFQTGMAISQVQNVMLNNVTVKDFYGNGITVVQKQNKSQATQSASRENVQISNCKIINVQGFNPKKAEGGRVYDNYGDGIYVRSGKSGIISGCRVSNDPKVTGKVGRAAIAITRDNINFQFLNDTASGYDRGVHIENTYGGHQVRNCYINDNNLGLVVGSTKCPFIQSNPLIIDGNTIISSSRDRSQYGGISSPGLIVLYQSDDLINGTKITNNSFIDVPNSSAKNAIAIQQKDLIFNNNTVKGSSESTKVTFRAKPRECQNNDFLNLNYLYIPGIAGQKNDMKNIKNNRVAR